jgi:hypothetical protein
MAQAPRGSSKRLAEQLVALRSGLWIQLVPACKIADMDTVGCASHRRLSSLMSQSFVQHRIPVHLSLVFLGELDAQLVQTVGTAHGSTQKRAHFPHHTNAPPDARPSICRGAGFGCGWDIDNGDLATVAFAGLFSAPFGKGAGLQALFHVTSQGSAGLRRPVALGFPALDERWDHVTQRDRHVG